MEQQKGCNDCKYMDNVVCTRERKIIGKKLNPYNGIYYNIYNINHFDLLFVVMKGRILEKLQVSFLVKPAVKPHNFLKGNKMTNKEKFANMYNLSDFAKNNPKFSIILAIIFILLFPFIYTVTQSYLALKEARIFKYFMYDWKRLIKMPKILIEYINCK